MKRIVILLIGVIVFSGLTAQNAKVVSAYNYLRNGQLDKAKESRIAKQLEEGASLYRRGKISEARRTWQKVLALDPQNQTAIEKVARADKVLKSIQELQKVK